MRFTELRRHGRLAPSENLAPVRPHRYRFEMTDGEVLTGALIGVTQGGLATIRLRDGAVVRRPCGRMKRLTELGPTETAPDRPPTG